jgi:hypothetical protein
VDPNPDLNRYSFDSPGTEGAPPVRGFVERELPETPAEEKSRADSYDFDSSSKKKLSSKERKAKEKSKSRENTLDDPSYANNSSPAVSPNTLVGEGGQELVSEPRDPILVTLKKGEPLLEWLL